jgi:putative FmdB family regulatory protein
MPVYTYRCDNCGVQFERRQSFSERNLVRCPECGKNTLHRVYRPVGVVFKGSGFYVTDNRSSSSASFPTKSGGEGTDSSGDKKSGGESGESTTGESKTVESKKSAPKSSKKD